MCGNVKNWVMNKEQITKIFTREKLSNSVNRSVSFFLLLLSVMLVVRVLFGIELLIRTDVEWPDFFIILSGFIYDVLLAANVLAILCIPLLCLYYFFPKITTALGYIAIVLYALGTAMLAEYFCNTSSPLDHVVLAYTPLELKETVLASVTFSFVQVVFPVLALIGSILMIIFIKPKPRVRFSLACIVVAIVVSCGVNYKSLVRNEMFYDSHKNFLTATNQLSYSLITISDYLNEEQTPFTAEAISNVAKQYHSLYPNRTYVNNEYPFWRKADDVDVLGGFFNKTADGKSPNIVFIIVESLGRRLTGVDNPKYSFTPFLDSLAQQSLYWENCLATAQRTFGVLPAVFASVPHGKYGFADYRNPMADHNSLLKDLAQNGYDISFFYGGNASFTSQNLFMKTNNVSYISNDVFTENYTQRKKQKKYSWGVDDADLFAFAEKRKQEQIKMPYADVYLTLTSHEPFNFPSIETYEQRILKMYAFDDSKESRNIQKNLNEFACFLYTDDCLRQFFDYYKKRKDFANTIFVITGDHRMSPLDNDANPLFKYSIPLIIYSPLLKSTKTMQGVVSQYDITPSIEAFLRQNYAFKTDTNCHWIGNSFDTSTNFRCNKKQAFMLNNRSVLTYLSDTMLFDCGRLYVVKGGLVAKRVRNDVLRDSLKRQLSQYQFLSEYAVNSNYLKPEDSLGMVPLHTIYKDLRQKDSKAKQGESQNAGTRIDSTRDFIVLASVDLPKNCKGIVCDMSFEVKSLNTSKKLPHVVFGTRNSKKYSMQRPMKDNSGKSLNTGKSEVFRCRMSVPFDSEITDEESFDVYLWNYDKTTFLIDKVNFTVFEKK